jgi:hypothetical protein
MATPLRPACLELINAWSATCRTAWVLALGQSVYLIDTYSG